MTKASWRIVGAVTALVACAVVLLGVWTFHFWPRPEATYKGKTVSEWLRIGPAQYDRLEAALAHIGHSAIPVLIRAAGKRNTVLDKVWQALWPKLPRFVQNSLARLKPVPTDVIRRNALVGLAGFGEEAESVLPALVRQAQTLHSSNPYVQSDQRCAIMSIGKHSLVADAYVLQELHNSNHNYRSQVASMIYATHFRLAAAVPLLMRNFTNQNQAPLNEDLALAVQGPTARSAVPLLIQQLHNPRMLANPLTALAAIGTGLGTAVPTLTSLLVAAETQGDSCLPPLPVVFAASPLPLLPGKFMIRLSPLIIQVLMEAGPAAASALPALDDAQRSSSAIVRVLADMAIARIRRQPVLAVQPLIQELRNKHSNSYYYSRWTVNGLDGPERLSDIGFNYREAAVWLLGQLGPVAKPAVPALTSALQDSDLWLPPLAARALFKITGQPGVALPTLLACFQSKDEEVNFLAIAALEEMGPAARPAIPALQKVQTHSLELRECARRALAKIGD